MSRAFIHFYLGAFLASLLSYSVYAMSHDSRAEPIPPHLPKDKFYSHIIVLDEGKNLKCPSGYVKSKKDWDNIAERMEAWNFSPKCLWDSTAWDASDRAGTIVGFSFGTTAGASRAVGLQIGSEVVMMPYDRDTLMVAQIKFLGGGLELSLPGGVSRSQSVIFGHCENHIFGYLGWFESVTAGGKSFNRGQDMYLFAPHYTGCNSITWTRGLTTSLLAATATYYQLLGRIALVQGPRVQPMIDYIETLNQLH